MTSIPTSADLPSGLAFKLANVHQCQQQYQQQAEQENRQSGQQHNHRLQQQHDQDQRPQISAPPETNNSSTGKAMLMHANSGFGWTSSRAQTPLPSSVASLTSASTTTASITARDRRAMLLLRRNSTDSPSAFWNTANNSNNNNSSSNNNSNNNNSNNNSSDNYCNDDSNSTKVTSQTQQPLLQRQQSLPADRTAFQHKKPRTHVSKIEPPRNVREQQNDNKSTVNEKSNLNTNLNLRNNNKNNKYDETQMNDGDNDNDDENGKKIFARISSSVDDISNNSANNSNKNQYNNRPLQLINENQFAQSDLEAQSNRFQRSIAAMQRLANVRIRCDQSARRLERRSLDLDRMLSSLRGQLQEIPLQFPPNEQASFN